GAGLDANQLTTISYGKERPAVEGHDESAWQKNRRGVLVLQ
ncbi:MAG: peptidoglycan-associated outer membrane lipoprotein, partial [Pseudomonadota bacterium]